MIFTADAPIPPKPWIVPKSIQEQTLDTLLRIEKLLTPTTVFSTTGQLKRQK